VQLIQESGIRLAIGFIMFEPDSTIAELAGNYDFLESLGLLNDHELTANLLYHSQITLYGSASWERFEKQGRLLREEGLPFEADYRFKNKDVARVCRSMRRMASEYFLGMDRIHKGATVQIDTAAVNSSMKEAFKSCIQRAGSCSRKEYDLQEEHFLADLRSMLVCRG
jgi:hypothetical protein